MKETEPKIEQKENKPFFIVYCQTEGRTIYESSGINFQIESIIARHTAIEHSEQLKHNVLIFQNGKII